MVALNRCGSSMSSRPVSVERQPDALELLEEATQNGSAERRQRRGDAGDRLQLLAEFARRVRRASRSRCCVGEHQPEVARAGSRGSPPALAEEVLVGLLLADQRRRRCAIMSSRTPRRERLAVDQHAVAVEDDQLWAASCGTAAQRVRRQALRPRRDSASASRACRSSHSALSACAKAPRRRPASWPTSP